MRKFAMSIFLATFLVMVLFTPLNDASSNGKPNSATGCSCHGSSSTSSVTPTHNFPSMYTPGQTYTITIGVNGGVSGNNGGFSLEVTQGTLSNAACKSAIRILTLQPALKKSAIFNM